MLFIYVYIYIYIYIFTHTQMHMVQLFLTFHEVFNVILYCWWNLWLTAVHRHWPTRLNGVIKQKPKILIMTAVINLIPVRYYKRPERHCLLYFVLWYWRIITAWMNSCHYSNEMPKKIKNTFKQSFTLPKDLWTETKLNLLAPELFFF